MDLSRTTDIEILYTKCANEYMKYITCSDFSMELILNLNIITYCISKDTILHSVQDDDKRLMFRTQNLILKEPNKEIFLGMFGFIRNYLLTLFIQKHFEKQQVRTIFHNTFPNDIIRCIEMFI